MVRGHSVSPTNLSNTREGTPTKLTVSSPVGTAASSPKSPRGRPNGLSPSGYREVDTTSSERLDKSCLSIASQCSRLSPTGSVGTGRSKASPSKSPNGLQHVSFENIFVDDERANEADDDDEDEYANEHARKNSSGSLERSKGTQVQSLRYVRTMTDGVEV